MWTKLNFPLLSTKQHPGEYRIHSEEMEMMAAPAEICNLPMKLGLRAVRWIYILLRSSSIFLHGIFLTLFFNFYCQSFHLLPPFIPIFSQSHPSYQLWILMFHFYPLFLRSLTVSLLASFTLFPLIHNYLNNHLSI